jgi:hypothetical protein
MSCRRVRRELLDTVRFGELGPGSAAHLEHLGGCRACRDEVGLDRALVAQLRRALAARMEPASPPSRAWYAILAEAQRPEPRISIWAWSAGLVGRLRTATAMAGTGLALLLALNMEVVPVAPAAPPAPAAAEEVSLRQVPRLVTGRTTLVALANLSNEIGTAANTRPDPEQQLMQADARVAQRPRVSDSAPTDDGAPVALRLVVRPSQTPEEARDGGPNRLPSEPDAAASEVEPVDLKPGSPS